MMGGEENRFKESLQSSVGKVGACGLKILCVCVISGRRKYVMFSALLHYVTLQDVVHLCPNNEACNPALHMCGNASQGD